MRSFALTRAREDNYRGVFQEVVQLLGEELTAKLVAQYGGTRLYVPSVFKPDHSLYQMLGPEAAQRLFGEFGGITVEVPRDVVWHTAQRNALIRADRATGMSQRALALKHHLTERHIRNILNDTTNPKE
jgi:Mor family transcriptional regulator